jgi:hypothetical protein
VESGAGSLYLSITITLKNTGLSKLPLNEKMKILRLSGITGHSGENPGAAGWERILSLPILKDHGWLEAQETVTETVVYSVGGPDGMGTSHAAYQSRSHGRDSAANDHKEREEMAIARSHLFAVDKVS